MSRAELVELARRIMDGDVDWEERVALMERFDALVPHPEGSGLFDYPENYNARRDNLADYDPTSEEVVDKALSYQPIILGPPPDLKAV